MAAVTITLTDEEGTVNISLEFGEEGADNESPAHHMAVAMVRSQTGGLTDEEEDRCGHG